MVNASHGSLLELARSVSLSPSTVGCEAAGKCGRDTPQGGRLSWLPPGWPARQFSVSLGNALSLSILSCYCHTCQLGCLHILEERALTSPSGYKEAQTNSESALRCRLYLFRGNTGRNRPPWQGTTVTTCMSYFMTGGLGKEQGLNKSLPTERIQERSKGYTTCSTISQNPPCRNPSWLSNALDARKDPESKRLATYVHLWQIHADVWQKSNQHYCYSHAFRETDSLRRTMQIVKCSLLRRRAQGRVSS